MHKTFAGGETRFSSAHEVEFVHATPPLPRVHLDNVPLHIVQRGHNRQPCFFAEEDYHTYLHWLNGALHKEHCALHAYALMSNHVHLLITPTDAAAIPKLIIALCRRYVQYINAQLDDHAISDIRLALNQNQPASTNTSNR